MATKLRKTGISVVGDVPWGTHFCFFYETLQDLLDVLVPYFKAGLENKEFCLWVISNSELLTMEEAIVALRQAVPDLDRYLADGSLLVVSHDEWFGNEGAFDLQSVANQFKEKLDEALARGYVGMRVNGSPAWLRTQDESELRRFEEELDNLFPKERIIASCTYPLAATRGVDVFDIVRTHRFAIARRKGEWEVVETPELMEAKAEIKRLNEELEHRVIERTRELAEANEELKREITERKRAEEKLRQAESDLRLVIDTIPTQVASTLPDGSLDLVNKRWEAYFGLSLKEAQGEGLKDVIHPEDRADYLDHWQTALATGEPFEREARLRRADGEYRWVLSRAVPLRDELGNITKWYGTGFDIEDRTRAEAQLKATSEQLRALSASLSSAREEEGTRIAREIHDELGSALTSLKWDLESIDKLCSEAAGQTDFSTVRKKIEAMIELIDATIKAVKRISSELRPSLLDDLGLAAAIEWQCKQFVAHTEIVCQVESVAGHIELSREQATAIFRIFQEAMTNILRHAQASRVEITMEEDDDEFVLRIRDNGRGITEEEVTGSRTLGLIGMRERVHLVGGKIEFTRAPVIGTVVTVRVPIRNGHPIE